MNKIEMTATTVDEAVEKALEALGCTIDECDIEIIETGSKGFLGFGAKQAKVVVKKSGAPDDEEIEEAPVAKEPEIKKPAKAEKPVKVEKPAKAENPAVPENQEPAPENEEATEAKPERTPLTPEQEAAVIANAKKFLSETFEAMNLKVNIDAQLVDSKQLRVNLSGDEMGVIIGKRGQTLDSLQYLLSLVVNKGELPYLNVLLDTEGYRQRRTETLESLAFNLAKKAKHMRKNVVLEPMNPYERRIIHSTLQNDRYVTTYSEGVEPFRYVVISPKSNYNNNKHR